MEKYNPTTASAPKRKHLCSIQQFKSKNTKLSPSSSHTTNPSVKEDDQHFNCDDGKKILTEEENIESSSCTISVPGGIGCCLTIPPTTLHDGGIGVIHNIKNVHSNNISISSSKNDPDVDIDQIKPIAQSHFYGNTRKETASKINTITSNGKITQFSTTQNGGSGSEDNNIPCSSSESSFSTVNTDVNEDIGSLDSGKERQRIRPSSYKAYHRQIEKRRRNKISAMINDIASLVPMCLNSPHRLDKLSVLEFAIQHMRVLTNGQIKNGESAYKPAFLTEEEIKYLMEHSGFLLVLSCDKAQILHISESVSHSMIASPGKLLGQSLLDIVHPKDVDLIKNMISPYPNLPTVGSATMYTGKGITGSKRSFYFRIKAPRQASDSGDMFPSMVATSSTGKLKPERETGDMLPVHMTGFLKSWQSRSEDSQPSSSNDVTRASSFACFIGLVKPVKSTSSRTPPTRIYTTAQASSLRPSALLDEEYKHYWSRHTADAKYLSVDKRVFRMSGYLPQELIGNSEYNFVHKDDVESLSETYRQAIANKHQKCVISDIYRFKMKHGGLVPMRTVASSLFNPFTHELEFITQQNYVIGETDNSMNTNLGIPSTSGLNNDRSRNQQPDEEMEIDTPKLETDLPLVTSQTLNILSGCGLNAEILSNLVKIQRVSTCGSHGNLLRMNSTITPPSDSGISSGDSPIDSTMLSNNGKTSSLHKRISESKMNDNTDKSSSGYTSGNDLDYRDEGEEEDENS